MPKIECAQFIEHNWIWWKKNSFLFLAEPHLLPNYFFFSSTEPWRAVNIVSFITEMECWEWLPLTTSVASPLIWLIRRVNSQSFLFFPSHLSNSEYSFNTGHQHYASATASPKTLAFPFPPQKRNAAVSMLAHTLRVWGRQMNQTRHNYTFLKATDWSEESEWKKVKGEIGN